MNENNNRLGQPMVSQSGLRNFEPIVDVFRSLLPASGRVLEIASGSGQHVSGFAERFPDLAWQPSDPDSGARASIEAYRGGNEGATNILPPLNLDMTDQSWPSQVAESIDVVFAANMVHISPWEATLGLLAGASQVLRQSGMIILYGPYARSGDFISEGNVSFNESLRARDPRWGIRDLDDMTVAAADHGFAIDDIIPMPANNFSLVLRPAVGSNS